jgi:hypothetical protein
MDACPISDCEYSDWTAWRDCSKTCAGGSTQRTRTVKTEPKYGGVACSTRPADFIQYAACNSHPCQYGKCSSAHIACEVYKYERKDGAYYDAESQTYTRPTSCSLGSAMWQAQGRNQPACHNCDSTYECNMKHVGYAIRVSHHKKLMYVKA